MAGVIIAASAFAGSYFGYNFYQDRQFAWAEEQRAEVQKGLAHAEDLASAFRNVGKVVEPAVVKIDVRRKALPVGNGGKRTAPDEDLLRRFFPDRDGDGEPDVPEGFRLNPDDEGPFEQGGTGSGVIMEFNDGKGFVLTNNHVAGGADEIVITLSDGREFRNGKVLGADPMTDLAVVEVSGDRLSPASWGNSDELQKGDWVMAFGAPFGYVGSMTHGIVSALNRQAGILGPRGYEQFIQVDAPINPGNSGGPLVNLRGEVVGINTAIASRNGGFQGIGFSVPSNQAKFVYQQLKEHGKVTRGWLGVGISDVAKDLPLAQSFGYEGTKGVLVGQVMPGTPAAGKVNRGDIITAINDQPVDSVQQLRNKIAAMAPNTDVKITLFRQKQQEAVSIKLGEQPTDLVASRQSERPGKAAPNVEKPAALDALGVHALTLTPEIAETRNLPVKAGVVVTRLDRNSPAARAGVRAGDVITEVADQPVKNIDELKSALEKQDLSKGVRVYVYTGEFARYEFIPTGKDNK
jgi:serine protease Do